MRPRFVSWGRSTCFVALAILRYGVDTNDNHAPTPLIVTPFCVSITGADDDVRIDELITLSFDYPFVEWGILLFPGREGTPLNPTFEWRSKFAAVCRAHHLRSALHLCGNDMFRTLLSNQPEISFAHELKQYDRVQVNINGRERMFSTAEVIEVYRLLWSHDVPLILQRHDGSADAIDAFLTGLANTSLPLSQRVSVLFDASCGKGKSPSEWAPPFCVGDIAIDTGYAGGISPENIESVLDAVTTAIRGSRIKAHRYWVDMQSGVRTGKQFNLGKVERVLDIVAQRFR